ncbi:hypothetical protein JN11_01236 [Mucilaginibacter frigoritolerans]|uniref:Uncharacterized protein n=1 Tax=Mucilaginibacter frigoritolerans TaxID=652788 RepID=A0A562U923_9SPHI|nr:hypothetical protein [Mucilaginibacter frigoritolerans]TWJ02264.1 hypothetical protein JN11_01236 [Mucilaginibacter frigoritolerans]
MDKNQLLHIVRYATMSGNILIIFWILFNAMYEGFKGTLPEKISFIVVISLLVTNTWLLLNKAKNTQKLN